MNSKKKEYMIFWKNIIQQFLCFFKTICYDNFYDFLQNHGNCRNIIEFLEKHGNCRNIYDFQKISYFCFENHDKFEITPHSHPWGASLSGGTWGSLMRSVHDNFHDFLKSCKFEKSQKLSVPPSPRAVILLGGVGCPPQGSLMGYDNFCDFLEKCLWLKKTDVTTTSMI